MPELKTITTEYLATVEKLWGQEYWIVNNRHYCMKFLLVLPGKSSSRHYHRIKDETFYVDSGIVHLELDGKEYILHPGQSVRIEPKTPHRFWNDWGNDDVLIVEVSTQHDDEDVVRLCESFELPKGGS